jgi:hypothetical protein
VKRNAAKEAIPKNLDERENRDERGSLEHEEL